MLFCFFYFILFYEGPIERSSLATFSPRIWVILRHWVRVGVRRWGCVEGYVKKNEFSWKNKGKQIFWALISGCGKSWVLKEQHLFNRTRSKNLKLRDRLRLQAATVQPWWCCCGQLPRCHPAWLQAISHHEPRALIHISSHVRWGDRGHLQQWVPRALPI